LFLSTIFSNKIVGNIIVGNQLTDSDDKKRLAEFEKKCQANLALDADGHLTYLATTVWRLGFIMEEWLNIACRKTREHN